jgi:hypothetical protein
MLLGYAAVFGDVKASDAFSCAVRTIQRYRQKALRDAALASIVVQEKARLLEGTRDELITTVIVGARRMRELMAVETDLHKLAGAVKLAGDLVTQREFLGVGAKHPHPNPAASAPQAPEGPAGGIASNGAGANGSNGAHPPVH